jgi:hypothetical protein
LFLRKADINQRNMMLLVEEENKLVENWGNEEKNDNLYSDVDE